MNGCINMLCKNKPPLKPLCGLALNVNPVLITYIQDLVLIFLCSFFSCFHLFSRLHFFFSFSFGRRTGSAFLGWLLFRVASAHFEGSENWMVAPNQGEPHGNSLTITFSNSQTIFLTLKFWQLALVIKMLTREENGSNLIYSCRSCWNEMGMTQNYNNKYRRNFTVLHKCCSPVFSHANTLAFASWQWFMRCYLALHLGIVFYLIP